MYEAGEGVAPAGVDRLLQRIQHKVRAHGGRHPPAHNASRKHVDDERDVDKAAPGCDVREIGDPELIRTGGHESAVNEVHRATALTCVGRGDPGPAPDGPGRVRWPKVEFTVEVEAAAEPVPTIPPLALMLLAFMLIASGAWLQRRRRAVASF